MRLVGKNRYLGTHSLVGSHVDALISVRHLVTMIVLHLRPPFYCRPRSIYLSVFVIHLLGFNKDFIFLELSR